MCLDGSTPPEEWRPVSEFSGVLEVSNLGRVRRPKTGHVLKVRALPKGYVQLHAVVDGRAVNRYLHRLVALEFCGTPAPGQEVNHIDGVKAHNCAVNLEWVSRGDNHRRAFRLGLKSHGDRFRGTKNGRAVITPDIANQIRSLKGKVRQVDLAKQYGLTQGHISRIQRGVAWDHASPSEAASNLNRPSA